MITDYLTPAQILLFQAVMIKFTIEPFNSSEQVYKKLYILMHHLILWHFHQHQIKEGIRIDT